MKKYLNIYTLIGIFSGALLPFISWGLSTRIFEYLIKNTQAERGGSQAEFIISRGFAGCMIDGFAIMQLVLPLLAVLFSFGFARLCKGYYGSARSRIKRYPAFVCKDILLISLTAAAALYLGFLLFWIFGAVSHPIITDPNYSRSFLNDIFGDGFAWKNPLLYYLIEGIYKYGIFPFVYCAFACTIYLYFGKSHMSVIIPTAYYTALSVLSGTLRSPLYGTLFGEILKALNPCNMLMMGAESGSVPVWYPLISLIPPIIASAVLFAKGIRNEKELY